MLTIIFLTFYIALYKHSYADTKEIDVPSIYKLSKTKGKDDTLRILNTDAATILNPHLSLSVKDWFAGRVVYEPLASFDKDGHLIPFLASEIPSRENGGLSLDGKSVTWRLKQEIKWSDGKPFTSDDVLFTYQFISNPEVRSSSAPLYESIESLQVISPYLIKINFKNVTPSWALPFVGIQGVIIPRHIFQDYNGANAKDAPANLLPVGTGPYRVIPPGIKPQEVLLLGTQLIETNKIVYEPNPYFRESNKHFFSRVELKGGGTVREAARLVLEEGGIDYTPGLERLGVGELTEMSKNDQGRLVLNFVARVERISLNRTDPNKEADNGERSSLKIPHPFFSDKRVRQAFAHSINREAAAAVFGSGAQPTTNNLVAPPQYNSPNVFYKFDLEKARALLDEAGWIDTDSDGIRDKHGMKMKVVYQTSVDTLRNKVQLNVQKDLKSVGIEVELKRVDPSIMFGSGSSNPDSYYRFNADLIEFAMTSDSPDPDNYMKFWTCGQIPQKSNQWSSGGNIERWCNERYDALYHESSKELNNEKRNAIFIEMNDILIEDVAMIPIVHRVDVSGVSKNLKDVELTPWDSDTWNIKDWRRVSK